MKKDLSSLREEMCRYVEKNSEDVPPFEVENLFTREDNGEDWAFARIHSPEIDDAVLVMRKPTNQEEWTPFFFGTCFDEAECPAWVSGVVEGLWVSA